MEQNLIEDLIIESIRIYGHDVWYIPRTLGAKDNLLNEDDLPTFSSAYMVEMYIKNVEGFEGDGDFLSKFGLQIRDSITFTIAMRKFQEDVGTYDEQVRPNEGDLIYFPLNNKMFEVKFVEHEAIFYQLGALQTFDLVCELWEYSNERLNTGIPEIDSKEELYSFDFSNYRMLTEDSYVLQDEDGYDLVQEQFNFVTQVGDSFEDNTEIETEADNVLDFSERDPFSEGTY